MEQFVEVIEFQMVLEISIIIFIDNNLRILDCLEFFSEIICSYRNIKTSF